MFGGPLLVAVMKAHLEDGKGLIVPRKGNGSYLFAFVIIACDDWDRLTQDSLHSLNILPNITRSQLVGLIFNGLGA